jgi:hypothetical protein
MLDAQASTRDPAWTRWLIALIVDFVVWAERPTGVVDQSTAEWLACTLQQHHDTRCPTRAKLIAREVMEEAQAFENDALHALAGVCRSRRQPKHVSPRGPVGVIGGVSVRA